MRPFLKGLLIRAWWLRPWDCTTGIRRNGFARELSMLFITRNGHQATYSSPLLMTLRRFGSYISGCQENGLDAHILSVQLKILGPAIRERRTRCWASLGRSWETQASMKNGIKAAVGWPD